MPRRTRAQIPSRRERRTPRSDREAASHPRQGTSAATPSPTDGASPLPAVAERLRDRGIQPTAQRVAIAEFVLATDRHPSADAVLREVRARFPYISRATVYNTLRLFVERGLLRQLVLTEGHTVFDPRTDPHHHFVDEATGEIVDVPWEALAVERRDPLPEFEVRDYQVVLRGTRRREERR